jgi:hypothetical protein
MLDTELYKDDVVDDPPARFATDAEIEFADRLRRRLEERYLARSTSPSPVGSSKGEGN